MEYAAAVQHQVGKLRYVPCLSLSLAAQAATGWWHHNATLVLVCWQSCGQVFGPLCLCLPTSLAPGQPIKLASWLLWQGISENLPRLVARGNAIFNALQPSRSSHSHTCPAAQGRPLLGTQAGAHRLAGTGLHGTNRSRAGGLPGLPVPGAAALHSLFFPPHWRSCAYSSATAVHTRPHKGTLPCPSHP